MDEIGAMAVSPAKAAALLGVSRSKLYELLNRGIPALKLGRRTLVRVADIENFLNSLKAEAVDGRG
jgi:excisionase family DNA binding protein